MSRIVHAVRVTVRLPDRRVVLRQGDPLPDGVPEEELARIEHLLVPQNAPPAANVVQVDPPAPEDVQEPQGPRQGAVAADLADWISSQRLTAPQTVDLAQGDPSRASVVLEAERLAHGGDGRVTVIGPLEKLAGQA